MSRKIALTSAPATRRRLCGFASPEDAARPQRIDRGSDQRLRDQGVAAHVPARLEPDPGVRFADTANVGVEFLVEFSCGDVRPMPDLSLLGVIDDRLVEKSPCLRGRPDPVIEHLEGARRFRIQDRLQAFDVGAALRIESDEFQSLLERGVRRGF